MAPSAVTDKAVPTASTGAEEDVSVEPTSVETVQRSIVNPSLIATSSNNNNAPINVLPSTLTTDEPPTSAAPAATPASAPPPSAVYCEAVQPPPANLRQKKADSEKSVSQLVNERKRQSKKNQTHDDKALLELLDKKYQRLANRGGCKYLLATRTVKCNCLEILDDRHYRTMVSAWTLDFFKKPKAQQDQQLMEWHRYVHDIKQRFPWNIQNRKHFLIPFNNLPSTRLQWDDDDDIVDMQPLLSRRVCSSAIMEITERGKKAWPKLAKAAVTTMIVKPHGNIGKKRKREDTDLMTHFTKLEGYGEVEATRFMRSVTGQLETRDNEDKDLRLPTHMGKRHCYREYGKQIGYTISKDEVPVVKWAGEGNAPEDLTCASWTKYRDFWSAEFPHLKVGTSSEDICTHCHQFAMRHKFAMKLKDPTKLGTIDDTLFTNINNADEGPDTDAPEVEQEEAEEDATVSNNNTISFTVGAEEDLTSNVAAIVIEIVEGTSDPGPGIVGESADDPDVAQFTDPDPSEASHDANVESNELMLLRAAWHIKSARAQRSFYQKKCKEAIECAKVKDMPHSERVNTLVVDYGQNMEMPAFNASQPGETYYYSPLSVYNLGVVNSAHVANEDYDNPYEHLHAHVYHKGQGQKGGNNVASLILKTLKSQGIMKENEIGGELNIIFDNCSGQNKNNTVISLVAYLVELGYFKEVNFIFLVVGHTKNAADRLFNALKELYRMQNIGTMAKLLEILNQSNKVTVHNTDETDFLQYTNFLSQFYRKISGIIKVNHIFSCDKNTSWNANQFIMTIRECDLPDAKVVKYNMVKQNFYNRNKLVSGKKLSFKAAVDKRPEIIREAKDVLLTQCKPPGINPYTQVELHDNFAPNLDHEDAIITCPKPTPEIYALVKKEGEDRKNMKLELLDRKKSSMKLIEEMANDDVTKKEEEV